MKINQKLCSWNKTLYKTWNNDYIKLKLLCLNTSIQKKKEEENNKDDEEEKEEENKGTVKRTPNQEAKIWVQIRSPVLTNCPNLEPQFLPLPLSLRVSMLGKY